jgi:hypothetical protein
MTDTPEHPDPKVVEALRDVLAEEHAGWELVEATGERFRAERSGTQAVQVAAMEWLRFEIGGYHLVGEGLEPDAWAAATRSNRVGLNMGKAFAYTAPVGQLEALIEAGQAQLVAARDPDVSVSSANPHQFMAAPKGNADERVAIRNYIADQRALLDKVIGALYDYTAARYQELRFGEAVESAFEAVRSEVDRRIGTLVPTALPKLSAAFENASSDNPEQWANAAAGCRRLLMAAADELRPPGDDVNGRTMGPDNYINRLVDWIEKHSESETSAKLIVADLADFGRRLDATVDAGSKGAHAEVSRFDAARFVAGTYLLLGDILSLRDEERPKPTDRGPASETVEPEPVDVSVLAVEPEGGTRPG